MFNESYLIKSNTTLQVKSVGGAPKITTTVFNSNSNFQVLQKEKNGTTTCWNYEKYKKHSNLLFDWNI